MAYIALCVLKEVKLVWYYTFSAVAFAFSQVVYFSLSKIICKNSKAKVDGSFLATLLETLSVNILYLAWDTSVSNADEDLDDDMQYEYSSGRPLSPPPPSMHSDRLSLHDRHP